jgi:hypothetical protein
MISGSIQIGGVVGALAGLLLHIYHEPLVPVDERESDVPALEAVLGTDHGTTMNYQQVMSGYSGLGAYATPTF